MSTTLSKIVTLRQLRGNSIPIFWNRKMSGVKLKYYHPSSIHINHRQLPWSFHSVTFSGSRDTKERNSGNSRKVFAFKKSIHCTLNTLYQSSSWNKSHFNVHLFSRNYNWVALFTKQFLAKISPKEERKRNFNQLKQKALSDPPSPHVYEMWKRGTRHKD